MSRTPSKYNPQTLMLRASSNAELSLTPRQAEVAVTELCPSNLLHENGNIVENHIFVELNGSIFSYEPSNRVLLICSQQYARIVKGWMKKLGVEDVGEYSTHSMRKTKPSVIYAKTHNVDAVRRLLGQSSVTASFAYLGVTDNSTLGLARNINI